MIASGVRPPAGAWYARRVQQARQPAVVEVVSRTPLAVVGVIDDLGGVTELADRLAADFPGCRFIGIVSADEGDDVDAMLMTLGPVLAEVVLTATASSRAADPSALVEIALATFGQDFVFSVPDLEGAIAYALGVLADGRSRGWEGDAVLIPGTAATATQARAYFGSQRTRA